MFTSSKTIISDFWTPTYTALRHSFILQSHHLKKQSLYNATLLQCYLHKKPCSCRQQIGQTYPQLPSMKLFGNSSGPDFLHCSSPQILAPLLRSCRPAAATPGHHFHWPPPPQLPPAQFSPQPPEAKLQHHLVTIFPDLPLLPPAPSSMTNPWL